MEGDTALATKMLKESGDNSQKVVVINPTDFPVIHPIGLVTADALTKMGMNVDLQETDWGSVVQRRASMQPVDKASGRLALSLERAASVIVWWRRVGSSGYQAAESSR